MHKWRLSCDSFIFCPNQNCYNQKVKDIFSFMRYVFLENKTQNESESDLKENQTWTFKYTICLKPLIKIKLLGRILFQYQSLPHDQIFTVFTITVWSYGKKTKHHLIKLQSVCEQVLVHFEVSYDAVWTASALVGAPKARSELERRESWVITTTTNALG